MKHFSASWKKAKEDYKRATNVKRPSEPGDKLTALFTRETITKALTTVDAVIAKGDPQSAASSERTPEWFATLGRAHLNYVKVKDLYLRQLDQALRQVPPGPEHVAHTAGLTRLKKELKALDQEMQAFIAETNLELKEYRTAAAQAALEKRKWVALFTSDLGRVSAAVAAVKANPTEQNYTLLAQNFEKLSNHLLHPKLPRGFGGAQPASEIARDLSLHLPGRHFAPTPAALQAEADQIKAQAARVKAWLRLAAAD